MGLPTPSLGHLFDATVDVGPVQDHGTTRAGHRRIVPILGGQITRGIDATIEPGGADWQLLRPDGAVEIDSRYSARTTRGELLFLHVRGLRSGPPTVLERLLVSDDVDPSSYYFRTSITIETSAPRLASLEHTLIVAACARSGGRVHYSAYGVL